MCVFCEQDPKVVGEFFGYPKCCSGWFVNHAKKYGGGDVKHLTQDQLDFWEATEGIGLMPCPKHATELLENKLDYSKFIKNRVCNIEFPKVTDHDIVATAIAEKQFFEWLKNK
jgi:hypothetical protein